MDNTEKLNTVISSLVRTRIELVDVTKKYDNIKKEMDKLLGGDIMTKEEKNK